jgi:hypothetical protein
MNNVFKRIAAGLAAAVIGVTALPVAVSAADSTYDSVASLPQKIVNEKPYTGWTKTASGKQYYYIEGVRQTGVMVQNKDGQETRYIFDETGLCLGKRVFTWDSEKKVNFDGDDDCEAEYASDGDLNFTLSVKIADGTTIEDYTAYPDFTLYRRLGGKWNKIETKPDLIINDSLITPSNMQNIVVEEGAMFSLPSPESHAQFDFSRSFTAYDTLLEPGLYRISGSYWAGDQKKAFSAEFDLVNNIPDYQNTAPLTAAQTEKICADYFAALPQTDGFETALENIRIKKYGGSYTYGEVVVMQDMSLMVTDDMQYIDIAGQTFELTSGSYRLQLHHNGQFIDIKDAYALGLLNRLDIAKAAAVMSGKAPAAFDNHTAVYGWAYGYYEGMAVGMVTAGQTDVRISIKNDEGYSFTCDLSTAKIEEVGKYNLDVENYYAGIKSTDYNLPKLMRLVPQKNKVIKSSLNTENPGSVDYGKSWAGGTITLGGIGETFEFNKKYRVTLTVVFENGYEQEVSGLLMGVEDDFVILE